MMQIEPPRDSNPRSVVTVVAALSALSIGGLVLIGWVFDVETLRHLVPGQVSMKANTATGFLLCGALLMVAQRQPAAVFLAARLILEALLMLLGCLTLAQYAFNTDLGVDQLLVAAPPENIFTASPGRMAPTSAIGFVLFAAALIADHWRTWPGRAVSRSIATLLLCIALPSLLGYAYGAPELYLGIPNVTAMALPTALLFAMLATGIIWLRPNLGFPALLAEDSITGTLSRSLLPMIIVTPLLVGGAVAAGYGTFYDERLAIALTALGSLLAASLVGVVSLIVLRRAEGALHLKDRALAATTSGIVITDHRAEDEPIVFVNDAFTSITGYGESESIGRNCRFLNEGLENPPEATKIMRDAIAMAKSEKLEFRNRRKDGRLFWNRLSLAPIRDYQGEVSHFVGVIDDVSGIRNQADDLRQALDEAEHARTMRDTFVRLISHELRTPLNAALTWIRLMEVDRTEETRTKGLAVVAQSIDSQSRLIDDLVDAARFTAAGISLESKMVDTRELVEVTVEELRPVIEAEREIHTAIEPGDYRAEIDPVRLQQIVRNLVNNAALYTPAGGRIDVRLSVDADGLLLEVADTGKGLTEEEITRIFEPFWRADPNLPGLGVGLTIVSALVSAHKGSIDVLSDGPGQGTSFRVRFPRDAAPDGHVSLAEAEVP